jgi:hypothetical protein
MRPVVGEDFECDRHFAPGLPRRVRTKRREFWIKKIVILAKLIGIPESYSQTPTA